MVVIIRSGAFRVMCQHIQRKNDVWYYRRRIPEHARALHKAMPNGKKPVQVFFSLKTTDRMEACRRADAETRRLDAVWAALKNKATGEANPHLSLAQLEARGFQAGDAQRYPDSPAIQDFVDELVGPYEPDEPMPKVLPQDKLTIDILYGDPIPKLLSDAKQMHFSLGKGPKGKVAEGQFNRAWNLLISITGDIFVEKLRREHANQFVAKLIETGVTGETIRKYLIQIRPVIETAILEFELRMTNPFAKVTIPNKTSGPVNPRDIYTNAELKSIQEKCVEVNDQRRWAIALLSDSMCRLSEVIGLKKSDVHLEATIPHFVLKPNETRRVKNKYSERMVPLVGAALWAARQAMKTDGDFLFPVFIDKFAKTEFTSNSASAALNKWLKDNKLSKAGQTIHSFRHTMRDRLRAVETPADVIDRIGGWVPKTEGEKYGKGHPLPVMHKYMVLAVECLNSDQTVNSALGPLD